MTVYEPTPPRGAPYYNFLEIDRHKYNYRSLSFLVHSTTALVPYEESKGHKRKRPAARNQPLKASRLDDSSIPQIEHIYSPEEAFGPTVRSIPIEIIDIDGPEKKHKPRVKSEGGKKKKSHRGPRTPSQLTKFKKALKVRRVAIKKDISNLHKDLRSIDRDLASFSDRRRKNFTPSK